MQHEAHVRNHSQKIVLIFLIKSDSIVVIGRHQDLRAGALTGLLLLLVKGIADGRTVLMQEYAVQRRQIGGIVADRVLHQQDRLHAVAQDVVVRVHPILDQLDDGDYDVRAVVPAEDVVYARLVSLRDLAEYLLRVAAQEHHGHFRIALLRFVREGEHIQLAHIVHGDREVELLPRLEHFQGLDRGLHPHDSRRVTQVQFQIIGRDEGLDVAVFLEGIAVVIVADEQDSANPPLHQCGEILHTSQKYGLWIKSEFISQNIFAFSSRRRIFAYG